MLKAIFLDLDETLCDTTGANNKALATMAEKFSSLFGNAIDAERAANMYIKGIYRELDERYSSLLLPVTNEKNFRLALIELILSDLGITDIPKGSAEILQSTFDDARTHYFDFFDGIEQLLLDLRKQYKLVVITNGPEFSQVVKVERVNLINYVDHIIIGGQEKEQKPAKSIFEKALGLVDCQPEEVIHVGDSLSADIAGANNTGIASIWIQHGQEPPSDASQQPTYTIDHPAALPALLSELRNSL